MSPRNTRHICILITGLILQQVLHHKSYGCKEQLFPPPKTSKVVVFYNLFVKRKSDIDRVSQIVLEQFDLLRRDIHHEVYVNLIGEEIPFLTSYSNTTKISLLQNTKDGNELLTLHEIWSFCRFRPTDKVVYLHSKGSFHPRPDNDQLRRAVTFAALSKECANMPLEYNICSMRMSPLPHAHAPGNMWLARCSYIQNLLEPYRFSEIMGFEDSALYGRGRYAAEHWAYSHPSVRPCDVFSSTSFFYGQKRIPSVDELKSNFMLDRAPRYPLHINLMYHKGRRIVKQFPTFRERLQIFFQLYGIRTPQADWWGWDFFNSSNANSSMQESFKNRLVFQNDGEIFSQVRKSVKEI